MSWTFSNSTSDLDQVRVLIGDTDEDDELLSNEMINAVISSSGGVLYAASRCARMVAAKYSRRVSKSIGDKSVQWGNLSSQYLTLAASLLDEAKRSLGKASTRISHTASEEKTYPGAYEHCDAPSSWSDVQDRTGFNYSQE